ncbi:MAG: phosphomethylpyrimidine synthase ThiC [Desulfobacterales bacterium]
MRRVTEDEILMKLNIRQKPGWISITVHCGITRQSIQVLEEKPPARGDCLPEEPYGRMDCEKSRGKPLYEKFDRLLAICREYDVTLSLGDRLPARNHFLTRTVPKLRK